MFIHQMHKEDWRVLIIAWLGKMRSEIILKTLDQRKPVILCGDLNVAHQEIDLKNPKPMYMGNAGFQ